MRLCMIMTVLPFWVFSYGVKVFYLDCSRKRELDSADRIKDVLPNFDSVFERRCVSNCERLTVRRYDYLFTQSPRYKSKLNSTGLMLILRLLFKEGSPTEQFD